MNKISPPNSYWGKLRNPNEMDTYFVYILTNKSKSTIYIGVTNDLVRRLDEHSAGKGSVFTNKYKLKYLMYFEKFDVVEEAITREKQLKKWNRAKKEDLINEQNLDWNFLTLSDLV